MSRGRGEAVSAAVAVDTTSVTGLRGWWRACRYRRVVGHRLRKVLAQSIDHGVSVMSLLLTFGGISERFLMDPQRRSPLARGRSRHLHSHVMCPAGRPPGEPDAVELAETNLVPHSVRGLVARASPRQRRDAVAQPDRHSCRRERDKGLHLPDKAVRFGASDTDCATLTAAVT